MTRIYLNQGAGAHFDIVIKKKKEPKADNQIMQLKPGEGKGEKYLGRVMLGLPKVWEQHISATSRSASSPLSLLIFGCSLTFRLDLGCSILSFNWGRAKGTGELSAQGSSL